MTAYELEISGSYARNTLSILADLTLVETPGRGLYVLTEKGEVFIR